MIIAKFEKNKIRSFRYASKRLVFHICAEAKIVTVCTLGPTSEHLAVTSFFSLHKTFVTDIHNSTISM